MSILNISPSNRDGKGTSSKPLKEEDNIPDYFIGAYSPVPPTALATVQERIDYYHGAITQVSTLEQKAFDSIRQYQMLHEEYQGRIFLKRQEIEGYEVEKKSMQNYCSWL